MEFNLRNRVKHPKILNLFPEYPCLKHEIHTAQSSTLIAPPQSNPNDHLNPNNRNRLKGLLSPKKKWTTNEDIELVKLVKQHGMQKWYQIARSMKGARNPKQCKERWLNNLNPDIKEDLVIDIRSNDKLFEMKKEFEERRMMIDLSDYPNTGPNHHHDPKSPGKA